MVKACPVVDGPPSIISRDRVKPSWPLKFVRTWSPTNRTLRLDALGQQHLLGRIGIASPNTSGRRLAQITLAPFGATQVEVEDSPEPHTVPAPIDAGDSFVAMVRGRGMRITATAMPSTMYVYSDFVPRLTTPQSAAMTSRSSPSPGPRASRCVAYSSMEQHQPLHRIDLCCGHLAVYRASTRLSVRCVL
jgi:hypothetical protein